MCERAVAVMLLVVVGGCTSPLAPGTPRARVEVDPDVQVFVHFGDGRIEPLMSPREELSCLSSASPCRLRAPLSVTVRNTGSRRLHLQRPCGAALELRDGDAWRRVTSDLCVLIGVDNLVIEPGEEFQLGDAPWTGLDVVREGEGTYRVSLRLTDHRLIDLEERERVSGAFELSWQW